jgi:hypothetical protein
MMDMNRRKFFALTAATAVWAAIPGPAAAALAEACPDLPVLVGDGVNDDAAALNAAIKGLPFEDRSGGMVWIENDTLRISGGTFRVTETIDLRNAYPAPMVSIADCTFLIEADVGMIAGIDWRSAARVDGCGFFSADGPRPVRQIESNWAKPAFDWRHEQRTFVKGAK